MASDDTVIGWARKQMTKEVTKDGLRPADRDTKMISLPTWLLIAILGGGGGYITLKDPMAGGAGNSNITRVKETANRALLIAEAAAEELAIRRPAIESIASIDVRVEALSENQNKILSDVRALKQDMKHDMRELREIILRDIRRRESQ